ncbi:MAG: type II toxin-antitoxin system VapC family toxin [Rhodothermales bacterium]|nr:type II toxin-antitoxin system VapC family toxin [Rhodothermales bacterium]
MKYLLDTNVISELVTRNPERRVLEWLDSQEPNSIYLSVITLGELQKGIARLADSERKRQLELWLFDDLLYRFQSRILLLDIQSSITWGELVGRLSVEGRTLPAIDSLIAAIALQHRCTLVTRNTADFSMTDVPLLNPWEAIL